MTHYSSVSESAFAFASHAHDLHKKINKKIQETNAHYKSHTDLHRMHLEFSEDNFIMIGIQYERFPPGTIKKLHAHSAGPHKILKKINSNSYVIDLPSNFKINLIFNISDLVAYKSLPFNPNNPLMNLDEPTLESFFEGPHFPYYLLYMSHLQHNRLIVFRMIK